MRMGSGPDHAFILKELKECEGLACKTTSQQCPDSSIFMLIGYGYRILPYHVTIHPTSSELRSTQDWLPTHILNPLLVRDINPLITYLQLWALV